jgi:hypothetical protein
MQMLNACRPADTEGRGLVSGIRVGQAMAVAGCHLDHEESSGIFAAADVVDKGVHFVHYHKLIELILEHRGAVFPPFPTANRAQMTNADPQQPLFLYVTAIVNEAQFSQQSERGAVDAEISKLRQTAQEGDGVKFKTFLTSGFIVNQHKRKGQTQKVTERRMQASANLATLSWKKNGFKGAVGTGDEYALGKLKKVHAVLMGSNFQGNFVWNPAKASCYFCLESDAADDNRFLNLEAKDEAERDMFVDGFNYLILQRSVSSGTAEQMRAFKTFDKDGGKRYDHHVLKMPRSQPQQCCLSCRWPNQCV